jgi:hypothetical protein
MALNVDQLKEGLTDYRQSLATQRGQLTEQFQDVNGYFNALFSVYGGRMAEELEREWRSTAQWFEHYLSSTEKLDHFLDERITELNKL